MKSHQECHVKGTGKIWIIFDSATQKQTKPLSVLQAQMVLLKLRGRNPQRFFLWTPGWSEWIPLNVFLSSGQTYFVFDTAPRPDLPVNDEKTVKATRPATPPPQSHSRPSPEDRFENTITKVLHPEFESGTDVEVDAISVNKSMPDITLTRSQSDHQAPSDDHPASGEFTHTGAFTRIMTTQEMNEAGKAPRKEEPSSYWYEEFSAEKIDPDAKPNMQINLPKNERKGPAPAATSPGHDNRRSSERHEFKIEVILLSKTGKTFRTQSMNISLGGTLLKDEIPKEFLHIRFDLILVNKFEKDPAKGRLHFQGRVVGDYMDPRRLMFLESDTETQRRLEIMLRSYLEQRKDAKKKRPA